MKRSTRRSQYARSARRTVITTSRLSPGGRSTAAKPASARGARETAEPGRPTYTCAISRPARSPVLVTVTRTSMPPAVRSAVPSAVPSAMAVSERPEYPNVVYDSPCPNG